MRNVTSEGTSTLWFPDSLSIMHRWQTIGLIVAPEEGNETVLNYFRVFISANSKAKVEKFVAYLEEKNREQTPIQVSVKKLPAPIPDFSVDTPDLAQYKTEEVQGFFEQAQAAAPDFLARMGDINIGIDQVHLNTARPCEITYTIDPDTQILSSGGRYSIQFSADNPFVSCNVSRGQVRVDLSELAYWQVWNPRQTLDVATGAPQTTPRIHKASSGIWQAEFTGLQPSNEFTFVYARLLA